MRKIKERKSALRNFIRTHFHRGVKNNKIIVIRPDGTQIKKSWIKGLEINFFGSDNTVKIYEPYSFDHSIIRIGSGGTIIIKENGTINNMLIDAYWEKLPWRLEFGKNFNSNGGIIEPSHNGNIIIGDNSMASWRLHLRSSDSHFVWKIGEEKPKSVYSLNKDIIIGNHVWIGINVTILKGVHIPDGCIVGAGAVVATKKLDKENCVIAGNPAKVVKTDTQWSFL